MIPIPEKVFEGERGSYFRRLVKTVPSALALHNDPGRLWDKDESGHGWANVTIHCLIEAARVKILASKLDLSDVLIEDVVNAAILHDFYKRFEIKAIQEDMQRGGSGRAGALRANKEADEHLRRAGFRERVIRLANAVGGQPEVLLEVRRILDQERFSPDDLAFLVMHYIDNYTIGSAWVEPAAGGDGDLWNDVDRRVKKNLGNSTYIKMDEESRTFYGDQPFFKGKTSLEALAELSHLIEERFAERIRRERGEVIEPLRLPEVIDKELKKEISLTS